MPLSDEVKRLLAIRSGRADPAPPKPDPPTGQDTDENIDEAERQRREGFRARAAREDERFQLATDSEYWIALCFRGPDQPARFCAALGLQPEDRYLAGRGLVRVLGEPPARDPRDRVKALMAARTLDQGDTAALMPARPAADPLADVPVTGDLQADAAAELAALLAALTAPPEPDPPYILDSPHWIVVYFASREDKDTFLGLWGLDVLGDKYLDGHHAARILHLDLH